MLLSLGRHSSHRIQIEKKQSLITKGPYRFVRHQLYSSLLLLHVSSFLLASNWFIGLTWLGIYSLFLVFRIPKEEAVLLGEFGELYQNYMKVTEKLFPKIGVIFEKRKSERKI